jgi:hypothetical protein
LCQQRQSSATVARHLDAAVDPKEISALGFMLSDKKAGPFKMEVESIKVERAGK